MKKWLSLFAASTLAFSASTIAAAVETESDWYLHLNLKSLEQSVLAAKVNEGKQEASAVLSRIFGEQAVNNTHTITVLGDLNEANNKHAIITGNYAALKPDIIAAIKSLGVNAEKSVAGNKLYYGNVPVAALSAHFPEKYQRPDSDEIAIEKIFIAFKDDKTLLLSQDEQRISNWLEQQNTLSALTQGQVFQVVVDVQQSMAHGGVNLDDAQDWMNFESISAKQLKQVSAKYQENAGVGELQLGLQAENVQTATQLMAVARGLIGLKLLTEKNPDVLQALTNIDYQQNGGEVLITLTGTTETLQKLVSQLDH